MRVVVLCASGRHFCGGADLRVDHPELDRPEELLSGPETGSVVRMIEYGTHRLVTALLDCQKPIIASVQGTAAGLGVQVALACDLVLMAQEASFIEVFVQRGIVPDGGAAYLLTRLAGLQRAKELMLLGDRVSADKARDYGLATEVVPLDELEARTAELAARLAQGPTVALGMMKRLANRALDSDRATALYEEALAQELVMTSRDARRGRLVCGAATDRLPGTLSHGCQRTSTSPWRPRPRGTDRRGARDTQPHRPTGSPRGPRRSRGVRPPLHRGRLVGVPRRAASRSPDILAGATERRTQGLTGPGSASRHVITTLAVQVHDDTTATADSYWMFWRDTDTAPAVFNMGHYHDTVRRGEGHMATRPARDHARLKASRAMRTPRGSVRLPLPRWSTDSIATQFGNAPRRCLREGKPWARCASMTSTD